MSAAPGPLTIDNAAWPDASPRLSVLIPFYRDDPRSLLDLLDGQAQTLDCPVEIVLLDDCGGCARLSADVAQHTLSLRTPTRLVAVPVNGGRAKGRNRLAADARAGHFLFLDSDMAPDHGDFLRRWLAVVDARAPVVFGGFSTRQAPDRPEHALHRRLAARSDCAAAAERALQPEKFVFTSNLLVRRDVFETHPFDEGFKGWGWEDVEWGARVSRLHPIGHIDNTATHLGLDTAAAIAGKYEQSAANFGRIARSHHDLVSRYPSYRAARLCRRIPARPVWRPALKALALAEKAPLPLRALAMRLYRAALCAEEV